jgi:hypothetical protein
MRPTSSLETLIAEAEEARSKAMKTDDEGELDAGKQYGVEIHAALLGVSLGAGTICLRAATALAVGMKRQILPQSVRYESQSLRPARAHRKL